MSPHRLEIGFGQQIPLLVAELPSANNRARTLDVRCESECAQHAHTVGVHQKPGSQCLPGLLSLHQFDFEAIPMEGCRRCKTSYTSSDDQDRLDPCRDSSSRNAPSARD
jgi:hypothetical protein